MNIRRLSLLSIIILCGLAATAYGYYKLALRTLLFNEQSIVIEIQQGESLTKVLSNLQALGVLNNKMSFIARLYAKQNGLSSRIRTGEFLLESGSNVPDLFALITSDNRIYHSVSLIEGTTFAEARERLANNPLIKPVLTENSHQEVFEKLRTNLTEEVIFQTSARASKANTEKNESAEELYFEGMLYPDTYRFHKGDTDLSILRRAHQRLLDILNQEWQSKSEKLPLKSAYEALILASIVEKETGHPEERGQIAGVFVRRLQKRMRLQTDPTVIYGLGDNYDGNITRADLRRYSPYNTYRIKGLPPTPIALAGRAAIHASLHPEQGTTLYFVAKGDGSHAFSNTIEEHNRAVRKFQLKRRSDYRSTHQAQ